jgi:chromosome segregation ATPase
MFPSEFYWESRHFSPLLTNNTLGLKNLIEEISKKMKNMLSEVAIDIHILQVHHIHDQILKIQEEKDIIKSKEKHLENPSIDDEIIELDLLISGTKGYVKDINEVLNKLTEKIKSLKQKDQDNKEKIKHLEKKIEECKAMSLSHKFGCFYINSY